MGPHKYWLTYYNIYGKEIQKVYVYTWNIFSISPGLDNINWCYCVIKNDNNPNDSKQINNPKYVKEKKEEKMRTVYIKDPHNDDDTIYELALTSEDSNIVKIPEGVIDFAKLIIKHNITDSPMVLRDITSIISVKDNHYPQLPYNVCKLILETLKGKE